MKTQADNVKIFGIGWNKTGTTTLGRCGQILGYTHKTCDQNLLEDYWIKKDFSRIRSCVSSHDFFEDWPWPLIYKDMDRMYPGSKFILTVRRNEQLWLKSIKSHSMRTLPRNHERNFLYGTCYPHNDEAKYILAYRNHNREVEEYFSGRNNDFISVCFEDGDGWEKLCSFLGKKIPDTNFPHENKSGKRVRVFWYLKNLQLRFCEKNK